MISINATCYLKIVFMQKGILDNIETSREKLYFTELRQTLT